MRYKILLLGALLALARPCRAIEISGACAPDQISLVCANDLTAVGASTAALQAQVNTLSVSTFSLQGQINALGASTASLQGQSNTLSASTVSLQAQANTNAARIAQLSASTVSLQGQANINAAGIAQLSVSTVSLQAQANTNAARIAQLSASTVSLQGQVNNLTTVITSSEVAGNSIATLNYVGVATCSIKMRGGLASQVDTAIVSSVNADRQLFVTVTDNGVPMPGLTFQYFNRGSFQGQAFNQITFTSTAGSHSYALLMHSESAAGTQTLVYAHVSAREF